MTKTNEEYVMRKSIFLVFFVLVIGVFAQEGKMYQSVPFDKATILHNSKKNIYCPLCGMTLHLFYKTNHTAVDENGVLRQYCSMHCLAEDSLKHQLTNIEVVDNETLKFIPAREAFYVVGSRVKGTMTNISKYAFRKKEFADAFATKYGGRVLSFDEAFMIAKRALKKEIAMIHQKQHRMAMMGKMIYSKMCKKDGKRFKTTSDAKAHIKATGICGNLSGKKLQAVGLYLSGK